MKAAILTGQRSLTHYATDDTTTLLDRVGLNTGNMAFITAIVDQFDVDWMFRGWDATATDFGDAELVVMPCANQFGSHTDMGHLGDLLLQVGKPVIAIGLGAQAADSSGAATPSAGTLHWVQAMQKLRGGDAPNILVRGEYSRKQLALHGVTSTEVTGCPSMFLSRNAELGRGIAARRMTNEPLRIAAVAGNSSWAGKEEIDQLMVSLATGSIQGLSWVLQEDQALVDLARGREISLADLELLVAHFAPGTPPAAFAEWARSNAAVFFDIESWMEHMQRFDVCVGPRFHGAMLAIQAGTPAVVITHDSRTVELCLTTGVPNVPARTVIDEGARSLWGALEAFDGAAFDRRRRDLASLYSEVLLRNGLRVTDDLKALTNRPTSGSDDGADAKV